MAVTFRSFVVEIQFLAEMYNDDQVGPYLGKCYSNITKDCWKKPNLFSSFGEDSGQYQCDDGEGAGTFVNGSDCVGYTYSWQYCDNAPIGYINQNNTIDNQPNWYNIDVMGSTCQSDSDCEIVCPVGATGWGGLSCEGASEAGLEGFEIIDATPVGICDLNVNKCKHPGYLGGYETGDQCNCYSNWYDCFGNCHADVGMGPSFDSCDVCGGSSIGCTELGCGGEEFGYVCSVSKNSCSTPGADCGGGNGTCVGAVGCYVYGGVITTESCNSQGYDPETLWQSPKANDPARDPLNDIVVCNYGDDGSTWDCNCDCISDLYDFSLFLVNSH